ncbi:hypothetical protein [Ohtaekwangia koreensis]|nr:hypothetical protein [Ohtaekwangia koreensis]
MKKITTPKNIPVIIRFSGLLILLTSFSLTTYAQKPDDWEGDGEIEAMEIEIVKERQITLPKANRNFDKVPPKPSEASIKAPVTYDFQSFSFQAPQINPQVRPLKLKPESSPDIYGGFLRLGYGNYASPLIEGYINNKKDKNKLIGARIYHHSSGKGPVDGKNSGSGTTSLSLYGRSLSDAIALSGNFGIENRTTHFYGYPKGEPIGKDSLKQSFNLIKLGGELSNAKNSDLSYKLGANFSYLADKYDARESEINLAFKSSYEVDDDSKIDLKADYTVISRKDNKIDAKPRSLFTVAPSYEFLPIDDLKLSIGLIAAFENDTIDSKSVHVYPNFKATYPLSPSVDAVGYMTGGMEKVSLQTLSNENLWLAPNVAIFHTNKVLDFGVGLNARLGNKVAAHAGLGTSLLKNWYSFVNKENDPSKFNTVYDRGTTKRTNLYVALSYVQSEMAKFMLRGDFYGYNAGDLSEVWHRPTTKLTANASINVYQKLIFSADIVAQGGMKALDPETDNVVKLDGAFDLNFKAEYLFSPSFSFFVQLNNITSNKYPLYLNYPVRGFQGLAGITWSF